MANHFKASYSGYRDVMRSRDVQSECLSRARTMAATIGGGPYVCDVIAGQNRAHARVTTSGSDAYWRERKAHYLRNAR